MKAPGCEKPVKFSTIASGNTIGAIVWSDGKREAPMLPDDPWLKKSPGEGVLFWSDECEEIGVIDHFRKNAELPDPEWKNLEFAVEPDEQDYLAAIVDGLGNTPEKLRYLRVRLWWVGNDAIRRGETGELSTEQIQNLRALEMILSEENPNERLMRAEVCRELGKFEEAQRLLQFAFPEEYALAVEIIAVLCRENNTLVARLNADGD